MAFREKSAWAMAAVMLVTGLFYAWLVAQGSAVLVQYAAYTIVVIVVSIVVQAALAVAWGTSNCTAPPVHSRRRQLSMNVGRLATRVRQA